MPQPYEQLAAVLRKMGHDEDAAKVMIEKNRDHAGHVRHTLFPSQEWLWYRVFGPLIGYGYRPWRAFWLSVAFIGIGYVLFWLGYRGGLITATEHEAYVEKDGTLQPKHEANARDGTSQLSNRYPKFNPFVYSLETFVPLLKLDMGEYWRPNANRNIHLRKFTVPLTGRLLRYYFWVHIIAGWVLTTLWVAGLTGLVKG